MNHDNKEILSILLVEDNKNDAALLEHYLRDANILFECVCVDNEIDYLKNLSNQPDIVISDYMLPQFDGLRALALLKQTSMNIPFVLVSGKIGEETAVKIMKEGANNYVTKDNMNRLPAIILHELEEVKVRNKLKNVQEQYEKLVTLSPDAIFIEYDERFVFVNQAGCRILGAKTPSQIIGKSIIDFIHPDFHDLVVVRLKKVKEENSVAELVEEKMINLKGGVIDVEVLSAPFQYEGKPGTQIFIRDVTSRKEAEQKIKSQKIKLKKHIKKNKKLKYADLVKSEFLATMSHELRSPLNAIIGFSELLKDGLAGDLTEKQKQYSKDIYTSGQYLLALINDILDLSKIEAGKVQCDLESVEMEPFLKETLLIVKDKATAHHIQLKLEIKEALGSWNVDRRRLKQIIYNLLSNAVKFTPDRGMVTLESSVTKEGNIEFSITDTGPGISEEDLQKLFHPFEQTRAAEKSREKGTGLGLVIAKQLTELHQGSISIESVLGKGTRFTVTFPRLQFPHVVEEEKTMLVKALVVEDDPNAAELVGVQLKELGIEMIWKSSAEEALSEMRMTVPDLIILDIYLPGMSGIEMMNVLKTHETLSNVPIIIVSIAADENKKALAKAVDVLQKPLHSHELAHSISKQNFFKNKIVHLTLKNGSSQENLREEIKRVLSN